MAATETQTLPTLSGRPQPVRRRADEDVRDLLLVALAVATGAVDAVSWLLLGKVFSAFMTGNFVFVGMRIAGADGPPVHRVLASIAGFGVGAAVAARIVTPGSDSGAVWARSVTAVLGGVVIVQAVFLAMWLALGDHPSSGASDALITVSALAMGLQTAAVFSTGLRAVFTTAATATWAVFVGDLSGWAHQRGERRRLGGVVAGLFAGAIAGGLVVAHARHFAPALPLALTALVVAVAATIERKRAHVPAGDPGNGNGAASNGTMSNAPMSNATTGNATTGNATTGNATTGNATTGNGTTSVAAPGSNGLH